MKFKTLLLLCFVASAYSAPIESGMCQPYFASIKANEANLHVGPGREYKILYKYIKKTIPLMVIAKYDHWRKVQDADGVGGWIHKSLLSNERYIMVKHDMAKMFSDSKQTSKFIASIRKYVITKLISVRGNWCNVKVKYNGRRYDGWIHKQSVFGVFPNETW